MNVYDFDNTIYDGESIVDFFYFCITKKKSLSKYIPLATYTVALYKMNALTSEKLYELASKISSIIVENKECANELIKEFWILNKHRLKKYYLDKITSCDVILTSAPRILIEGILEELKTNNIICSEFNLETGKFEFLCYRENIVVAFKNQYHNAVIEEFYTDSMNDLPIIKIANKSYLVKKKEKPKLINKNLYK